MSACAVPELMAKDPRFQALKKAYADKHYSDDHIAQALQFYRERTGRDSDWFPESPQYRAAFTRFINNHLVASKLAKTTSELDKDSVYNMYTTLYSLYTPERLDNRIKMIARDFRQVVDILEKNDKTNRTRQQLIEAQGDDKQNGFSKIMQRVFKNYEGKFTDVDKMMSVFDAKYPNATETQRANALRNARHRAEEYKTVLANKERLAALAATSIGEDEGFVVNIRNFEVDLTEYDEDERSLADGSFEDGNDDGHDKEEGSKGDRFADFRTLKLMSTLSVRARRLISRIPKVRMVEENGVRKYKPIKDDLGVDQYIGGRQVAVILKRVLVNSSPDTMMSDLRTAAEFYPWLNSLILELEKDTDAQTTIYNNFKSAESTYVYVNLESKKRKVDYGDGEHTVWESNYIPKVANTRAARHALMREAENNAKGGYVLDEDNTVYTGYGSLVSLEKIQERHERFVNNAKKIVQSGQGAMWIRMVDKDAQATSAIKGVIDTYGEEYKYLLDDPEKAMNTFLDRNPGVVKQITDSLRGLGFPVREKDIREIATQKMNKKSFGFLVGFNNTDVTKGRNKLYQLVEFIDNSFTRAEEIQKKNQEATGQYLFGTSRSFEKINNCLALAKYNEVEARVLNEGKSLSTYNHVNLLHQTFDSLMNSDHRPEQKYQEDLEGDYLQYEGMALGYGDRKQAKGWLKMFRENTNGIRDKMRIIDCAAFNHVEYADLSRRQKLTNSIVMYFGGSNTFQADGYAAYEVPIQADYSTAYNFILAPKLAVGLDQSDVVEALVDEVKMELERIAAIEARIKDDNRIKLSVYEEQGLKFQIFPAFNDNGFRQKYTALADKAHAAERLSHIVGERAVEPLARRADNFIREQVQEQMTAIVQRDLKTIEEAGVLSNPAMKHIHFGHGNYGSLYSKDGKIGNLKEDQLARLNEYCQNVFYARQQTVKLLTGGTEQFNGLIDFEKRNMLSHATHTSLYTKATWKGEQVGRETQNVVYIEDDNASSAFLDDIKEMALQLKNEGIISAMQYDSMIKAYSKIKTTDGQGLRTLESYRRVMIMADQWDNRHESAYQNIISGKPTKDDVAVFMQNIKPVLTGYEAVPAATGVNQKPVKLTVLHKYSEMVLLPMALSKYCLQNKSVPMQALENAQKRLKEQGKEIDMFLFHSGVKVGAHSILQPFAKDKKTGERILKSASDISRYLVEGVNGAASTVHTIPFKYYGIAASTPAHVADDRIAWASQAEKVAWANIDRNEDKITLRGEKKSAWDARETYNKIKSADIIQMYTEIRKLFNDPDELEKIFQEELASKSYSSRELSYALSHLKDGTFALPLYSPNVEHQVQQLLASIIKKRLTKPKLKGANILQSTGLGMDVEASSFDNTNALSEDEKLHIVFEGDGKNKRIKYVEVYLPIHDSRLLQFADENGNITYEMLYGKKGRDGKRHGGLIERGVIPESVLNFIAYRTPSDAEHSVIPCRIKGFIANTAGATIRMPKEIMVTTGHDYDGDKMRCHFADFTVGWDEEALSREYQKYLNGSSDTDVIRYILGQEEHAYTPDERENLTEEEFKKRFKRAERQIGSNRFKKVNYIAYDYNKSALENSKQARANARVELMFSQLTSPAGSKRVIIPGGCDESKVIAKTLYLVRSTDDNDNKKKIADELLRQYKEERYESYAKGTDDPMDRDEFFKSIEDDIDARKNQYDAVVGNTSALYEFLIKRNDGSLTDIVRAVSSAETPYSVTHSADAFDYIMGGAEMIGIYAVYNSAMQMLQRLDLRYVPKLTEKGKPYEVNILGHKWGQPDEKKGITGKLFEVRNHEGNLASLGLARLLNAAVDNNKDPILGYLMQTKEMAETTFLMFAAGMTEEEIHLFMNQPAIAELINRMKQSDNKGLYGEAAKLISELSENNEALANESNMASGQWFALSNVAEMSRADFTKNLALKYENIKDKQDLDLLREQVSLLQVLLHLQPAANNLAEFVRLTRPESESGSIGTTVSSMITKTIALRKFREKLEQNEDQDIRISGMWDVIAPRDVFDGVDEKYLEEVIGDELPEVVALNSLMLDSSLDIFEPFFPTARKSWVDVAETIASAYKYNKIQEGTVEKVGKEMILWKLLGHPKFVQGDPQVEQKRIIVDVPKNLKDLKQRIGRAANNPGQDPAADALVGNAFLMNLTTTDPTSTVAPRLQFQLNGPAVEGTADAIRASWGEMLNSSDEKIRQLAIDLFKYNLYTNGFSYGMYEFSHFAPFSVIVKTPGYIEALKDILNSNWDDEADTENFIHQYYMNHWGDKKFLPQVKASSLKVVSVPQGVTGQIWLSDKMNERTLGRIIKDRYIVLTGEEGQEQTLWRVLPGNSEAPVILERAEKLGVRNFNSQVTLQYNPRIRNYKDVHPVVPGNDSAWGQLDELNTHAESDISNPGDNPTGDPNYMKGLVGFGKKRGLLGTSFFIKKTGEQLTKVEKQAAVASSKNEGKIPSASSPVSQGRKWGKKSANGFEVSTAAKGENGDSRFSALNARLSDGRTIEEAYQLDVKGYRQLGYTWSQAKHDRGVHAPIPMTPTQLYDAYLSLWRQWANENPKLIEELREKSKGKVLTDVYASDSPTAVSQARALAQILDETEQNSSPVENQQEPASNPITPSRPLGAGFFGALPAGVDMSAAAVGGGIEGNESEYRVSEYADGMESAMDQAEAEEAAYYASKRANGNQMLSIARRDENGNIVTDTVPATPNNVREARKQQTFVELNRRLREILRDKGIDVGVLTNAEARMALGGVADFDTANVTAEGLLEMIRIAEGYRGEYALPEEFAHVALEMLGHNHPLVSRLLSALNGSQESMEEAYDGQYQEYLDEYGEENRDKFVLEAAGKLVAKHLFYEQEIQSSPVRRLVHRIVDAIKSLLRRFSRDEVQNAIFDANQIASKIAREMLGGRLIDSMSLENIATNDKMFQKVQKDLSGKQDILSKLLKTETKRLAIFKKRQGHNNKKQSKAVQATEAQIAKLEAAIKNYKTEDAIVNYMSDSLGFLAAMEKSLDDVVNGGYPVNVICKRLNLVRDTLYSFSKAIEDIRESIIDGEVQDSANLTATMDQVAGVLEKFFQKYNKLARTYFEEMLSSVYGESGKTITVGKDKGKVISIKDMARRADHDISLVSRWFHSIADCDDYVLKAIDDVARNAKIRARRIAAGIRPRIEVAITELEKATGSRDQSFMFELEKGEDGKMHRTGKYITEKASESLSTAQKKFYDTMMSIKNEADKYVPESLVSERKIVMMRKYTMDRFKDAEGAKGKALEAWEGLKNRVMETGDDIDYDNYEVAVDFEGNRVDMLPVKFMMKGKSESYDDMTDDVATSIMAYAGMAYEYNELNSVIGILENAKYMSSQRDVVQKTGTRTQRESISTDDTIFREPFTVKQAQTNIQKALDDFFQMHIYGHIRKNEGTIGRTRFSKRKVVDTINAITSYSQMAINIPQRIANVNTGLSQIVIESIGRTGEFSTKDVAWASKIYAKESGDRLAETGKSDYDNKLSLWDEYFDVHQDNGKHDTKYKKGRLSRIFNSSLLYAGLTMGEDYLASTTSLALARNYKVKNANGKEETLWDAYEVKYADSANKVGAYLSLKEGYTKLDGSPITFEDERAFAKKISGMNFQLQGIYNTDDKSAIQQYAFGALLIMYRKWIAPALKRRYSGVQYNALRGDYEEGYHRTLFRVIRESLVDAKDQVTEERGSRALLNIIDDMKALKTALVLNWNKLTPYEKSNITRSLSELAFVAGLYLAVALLGKIPPPETDEDAGKVLTWWENTVMSQILRLRTEIGSQAPTPMLVDEAMHILRSPFAAIEPLQNTINAFELFVPSNYMKEIKSGRYKGHVKAYKYFRELPIISMFKKVDNFLDPSPLINYYQNDVEF